MTLDECVYALADLLDKTEDAAKSCDALQDILSALEFSVDKIVEQFIIEYACTPEVYVKNLQEDRTYIIDLDFESL